MTIKSGVQLWGGVTIEDNVFVDDGENQKVYTLNRPYYGLLVPPGIWAAEQEFSSGSVCLVLTDNVYEAKDYIRDYNEFLKYKGK